MIYLTLFIAIVALACALASLVIAIRERQKKELATVKQPAQTTTMKPVESPFMYDESRKSYTLYGNLYVSGSVSCAKKGEKA